MTAGMLGYLVRCVVSDGYTGRTVYGVIRAQSASEHIATIPVECPVDGLIAEGIGVCAGGMDRHGWLRRKPIAGQCCWRNGDRREGIGER